MRAMQKNRRVGRTSLRKVASINVTKCYRKLGLLQYEKRATRNTLQSEKLTVFWATKQKVSISKFALIRSYRFVQRKTFFAANILQVLLSS